jgi:diguanylate cyclase (GGDEF)-like protein
MARPGGQWSLRSVIVGTTLGLVVLLLLAFGSSYLALRRATSLRTDDRLRFEALTGAADRLMLALVDQEVGLRGFLLSGDRQFLEPYERGRAAEREAQVVLRSELREDDDLDAPLASIDRAIETWQGAIAEPQVRTRESGPLPDLGAALIGGKQRFDAVRARQAELAARIHARAVAVLADDDARVERINVIVAIAAAIALIVALIGTRYMLRYTAEPLAELARRAELGEPFASPAGPSPIREVHSLSSSLYELDAKVFVREQALAAAHDEAVSLTRYGEHVQQLADEDELHDVFGRVCAGLLQPTRSHILVRNASKNRLEVVRPAMSVEEQLAHPILNEPMRCRAVRSMREVAADADAPTACKCALGVPETGSYLCVPMLAAGELVGVTNLQSDRPGHFTADRIRQIQGYTGFTGATLSSLRLIAATRERALRDGLTGAYNRAFLVEYLGKTIAGARRRNAPLAVLMCDLDHFKRINDEHGHQVGDHAIAAFASCLRRETRETDAVVRYGGEEFLLVLPDAGAEAAVATAERIRGAVERTSVSHGDLEIGPILRTSIGVATFPDHGADDAALIAAADAALYRAKTGGRNRVELARTAS